MTPPISKSPFNVVVAFPLFGDVLFPCAVAVTSSEFEVATPEYSRIANRKIPETVSNTVTVFAPPLMFSADLSMALASTLLPVESLAMRSDTRIGMPLCSSVPRMRVKRDRARLR